MRIFDLYWLRQMWYEKVVVLFFPRNRWANKVVPRTFTDVDYIYEEVLFAGLKFFWEEDRGEESLRYQWEVTDEYVPEDMKIESKEIYFLLKDAYEWSIVRRTLLDDFIDFETEQKWIDEDTKHLSNIVKYRKYMWT